MLYTELFLEQKEKQRESDLAQTKMTLEESSPAVITEGIHDI